MVTERSDRIIYIATIVFSLFFIVIGNRLVTDGSMLFGGDSQTASTTARIEKILDYYSTEPNPGATEPEVTLRITFEASLTSGERKGMKVVGVQVADSYTPTKIREAKQGDDILLFEVEETDPQDPERWMLQEFVRTDPLAVLFALFILALIVFGRKKGVNTVISLAFTCLAVFGVFVPSVLSGFNIYATSGVVCLFIIGMTLLLVNGANSKSFSAGMGCAGGIAVSGALVLISNVFLGLTGMVDEQSVYLLYLNPSSPIDLKAVIFSSIIIGALGATLDVSVSIASALSEIRDVSERPSFTSLFSSGMNIGRDIMGTMANTLVLAYIGSSLSLVLLLLVNSTSLADLLNREIIVVEILRALSGSIGLLCTIPLTSLLSAYVYTRWPAKP